MLDEENRRLKKLLAEAAVDNSVLKDLLRKTGNASGAICDGQALEVHAYTERRACRLIGSIEQPSSIGPTRWR